MIRLVSAGTISVFRFPLKIAGHRACVGLCPWPRTALQPCRANGAGSTTHATQARTLATRIHPIGNRESLGSGKTPRRRDCHSAAGQACGWKSLHRCARSWALSSRAESVFAANRLRLLLENRCPASGADSSHARARYCRPGDRTRWAVRKRARLSTAHSTLHPSPGETASQDEAANWKDEAIL